MPRDGNAITPTRSEVAFAGHDGTTLRGWLHLPDGAGPHRGVVAVHGFSATKEMALDRYAEVLCERGMAVLAYDHRCLGASDGEPRQLIDPWGQMRDLVTAIGWLADQDGVDAGRLGVWGSSFAGGEVLVVGAADPRVRAVVANVPFVGDPAAVPDPDAFDRMRQRLATPEAVDELLGPLAVVGDPAAVMPHPEAAEWFEAAASDAEGRWRNEVWLPGGTSMVDFDPASALPHLHAATLLVVASADVTAPTAAALAAFERLPEPKELLLVDGHHFAPYTGDGFVRSSGAAADFFLRFL